jgi:hypothetical protein
MTIQNIAMMSVFVLDIFMIGIVILTQFSYACVIMLTVILKCRYDESLKAKSHCDEWHYPRHCYAERAYAECRCSE